MLSEASQRKTNTVWSHLCVESKTAEFIEIESRKLVAKGWGLGGGGGNGEMLIKGYQLPAIRWLSSGDLMYSTVTVINSTVLCTWMFWYIVVLLRE